MDLYLFYTRCLVAFVACAIAFSCQVKLLLKFENGFYGESEVPFGPLDAAHKRARRSFYVTLGLVLLPVLLISLAAYEWSNRSTWTTFGFPFMVGGCFSMLYSWGTRCDRVRPRPA